MKNKELNININSNIITMTLEELALQGKHNAYNSMAASITAKLIGIRKETIKQCLTDFQNVEHRLEFVARIHGVDFINDSKATNVNATYYALDSMSAPTVWIVGGVDKGNDYLDLMPLVREKVKAIVCLGVDNQKIIQTFNNVVEKGDAVLLSPACASFDLFESYEDRGTKFKKAVREL